MEKREQIARTDTPTKHKNTIHDLRQEKNKTKQKQANQNWPHQTDISFNPAHKKNKEKTSKNSHKQENNTTKTKARKQTTKIAALFVF